MKVSRDLFFFLTLLFTFFSLAEENSIDTTTLFLAGEHEASSHRRLSPVSQMVIQKVQRVLSLPKEVSARTPKMNGSYLRFTQRLVPSTA